MRDYNSDQRHVSDLFDRQRASFGQHPLGGSFRGSEDPSCGNAFGLGYRTNYKVP